jgi:hypothetical protein
LAIIDFSDALHVHKIVSFNFILKEHEMRQVSGKLANWLDAYNRLAKQLEETGFKATPARP